MDKFHSKDFRENGSLVDSGRAHENFPQKSMWKPYIAPELEMEFLDSNTIQIETLYLNVHGDIIPDCDLSYKLQEKVKVTNVLEERWIETLAKTAEKQNK